MNSENNEKVTKKNEELKKESNQVHANTTTSTKSKSVLKKRVYIDTPLRIFIIVGFVIIFAMVSLISLKNGLQTKTYSSIAYNERSTLDYKVYLKENPYFTQPYLGKGQQYIASIIDYIDADFKYIFNASDLIDYEYKYLVRADVSVYEKGNTSKVLYTKSDVLVPETKVSRQDTASYVISENLKIDYNKYNNIVSSFKKDYSLALESELKVTLYIFFNGTSDRVEQPLASTQTMNISMPLTEQTIDVGLNYKEVNNADIVEEYSIVETKNIICFVVSGVSLLLALIFTVVLIRFINKIRVKGTEYDRILGRILKDYEGIVARVKKVPDFKDSTVVELESFDEILDISEKLDKPILFIEMHKHQKSWFMVVNNREIYKYALKLVDVDKASKEK